MKHILAALIAVVGISVAHATEVNFAWDNPDPPAGVQYELFVVQSDQAEWAEPVTTVDTTSASVDLDPMTRYKATVRARLGENVSGYSNIIVFRPGNDPEVIVLPDRPGNLSIKFN